MDSAAAHAGAEPGARGRGGQRHASTSCGIAKNAREEKLRAREAKLKQDAENARMAKLYREQILGEKPVEGGLVSIDSIAPAPKLAKAEEPVMGD